MDMVKLGRTGLEVSVVGLGCGGHSRLGLRQGMGLDHAVRVVSQALDLGITFFDTAQSYGTEQAVGLGVAACRSDVIISTKTGISNRADKNGAPRIISGQELVRRVEDSLRTLNTDYIDIFNLHGVEPAEYENCLPELTDTLRNLQGQGKIRFTGLTEFFQGDKTHEVLSRACRETYFDVIMTGFNFLNQTARASVFPLTMENGIGTQIMFAVRKALASPATLQPLLDRLSASGEIDQADTDAVALEKFLIERGGARNIADAAYRFCRHEPGAEVILTGTGNPEHLKANVRSILSPPLALEAERHLRDTFANVSSVTGNE